MEASFNIVSAFFKGSSNQAKLAAGLEATKHSDSDSFLYLSYVIASISQSVAALEAEAFNIINYGIGHTKGSNGYNLESIVALHTDAAKIDRMPIVDRYSVILQILGKEPMNYDEDIVRDMHNLYNLRNETTHYKSFATNEIIPEPNNDEDSAARVNFKLLDDLGLKKSHFYGKEYGGVPLLQYLGYETAKYSNIIAKNFLVYFYNKLGEDNPYLD
jgi:hypothetical protein